MDYFNDILATFLDLDRVNYIAIYGRVRELSEFIKNIFKVTAQVISCNPKGTKGYKQI